MGIRSDRLSDDLHVIYTPSQTLYAALLEADETGREWALGGMSMRAAIALGKPVTPDLVIERYDSYADVLYAVTAYEAISEYGTGI